MANIRIQSLPAEANPSAADVVPIDGATTRKATIASIVAAARPLASQAEAEAGTNADKAMTPLTTAQAITAIASPLFATSAQGAKADTAVQPGDLAAVATSGSYEDLTSKPLTNPAGGAVNQVLTKSSSTDGDYLWATPPGIGDMVASEYDPQGVNADAFDRANHTGPVIWPVADRTALAALPLSITSAYLTEAGREGLFKWVSGNLSTLVAADTQQGIYVAPTSDPTGASGAWVRVAAFAGPGGSAFIWLAAWWGVTPDPIGDGTGPDQAPAINSMAAVANIERPCDILFGGGLFPLDAAITKWGYIAGVTGQSAGGQPTVFYKRYVEADANRGVFSSGDYAATYRDIQFAAAATASGGSAISAILETADRPNIGILNLERIYVSGGNGYNQDIHVNGLVNDPPAGGAAGASYRSARIKQCHFFGAKDYCVVLLGVQHVFGSDNFIAGSGGSINSGFVLYISGSANAYCDDITFTGGIIAGNVYCDFIGNVTVPIDGRVTFDTPIYGNLTVGGSPTGPVQIGYVTGSITDSNNAVKRTVYKVGEGSNANGSWVKYSDGRLRQEGSVVTSNGDAGVTFPTPFAAAPTAYGANCPDAPSANFINLAQVHSVTASTMGIRAMTFSTANNVGLLSANAKWWAEGY